MGEVYYNEGKELKENKRTTKHDRTGKNCLFRNINLSVSRRKPTYEGTTRPTQTQSSKQTKNDDREWRNIIITPEAREYVKKICYKNWGLNKNGTRKRKK